MKDTFANPNKEEYNDEPVHYCANCLSLKIKRLNDPTPNEFEDNELGYCDMCTSTNIKTTHIYDWEKLFQVRYGYRYTNRKINKK